MERPLDPDPRLTLPPPSIGQENTQSQTGFKEHLRSWFLNDCQFQPLCQAHGQRKLHSHGRPHTPPFGSLRFPRSESGHREKRRDKEKPGISHEHL